MRRPFLPLLAWLFAACLPAGEAALSLMIPDQQRLQRRLAEGSLARFLGQEALRSWMAATAGGGAGDLRAVLSGGTQFRLALDRLGRPGGLPSGQLVLGTIGNLDLSGRTMPVGLLAQQAGAWTLIGGLDGKLLRPEAAAVPDQWVNADMIGSINLPAWVGLLPVSRRAAVGRLLQSWKLTRVTWQADIATRREQLLVPGASSPLRPIMPADMIGLPEQPDVILAAGLTAESLAAVADDIIQAAGLEAEAAAAWSERRLGAPVAELLGACSGTVWLAVVGEPRRIMISLPQHPVLVAALHHWILAAQPETGEVAQEVATTLVASARTQPLPLAWLGGVGFVRLAHDRIYITDGPRLLDGLSVDEQPAPVVTVADWSAEACLRLQWQPRAWTALAPGSAPVSASPWDRLLGLLASSDLPGGWAEAKQETSGLRVDCEGPLTVLATGLTVLPGLLPDWLESYTTSCAAQHLATMQLLIQRAKGFSAANSNQWPRDLPDLLSWASDLDAEQIAAAGRPDLTTPFIYVQPIAGAHGDHPVLVQDPALHGGRGSLVGFADGRVEFQVGLLFWSEAKRLVALPEVHERGAAATEWATMAKIF